MRQRKPRENTSRPDPYNICRVQGGPPPSRNTRDDAKCEYNKRRRAILSKARYRKVGG